MIKLLFVGITTFAFALGLQQDSSYEQEIKKFQDDLNAEFMNPDESPLTEKERKKFKGHNFFAINKIYRVTAVFTRHKEPVSFQMKTTTDRLPEYDIYGVAQFEMGGKTHTLNVYQSHKLRETEEYADYLFLPFTDLTNGNETYAGGRYLDLRIPDGDTLILDFNKAYCPFCAYNHSYSCPIPPAENDLELRIEAGVKNLE